MQSRVAIVVLYVFLLRDTLNRALFLILMYNKLLYDVKIFKMQRYHVTLECFKPRSLQKMEVVFLIVEFEWNFHRRTGLV